MESEVNNTKQFMEAVESLRRDLAGLTERMAALEKSLPNQVAPPAATVAPVPVACPAVGISDEIIAVLSAALAAYLGVKPRIRQIRLLGSAPWVQQGRATIQASHSLVVQHG